MLVLLETDYTLKPMMEFLSNCLFTKEKVDLSRLIVFGSKCAVHQLGSSQAIKVFLPPRKVLVRYLIRVHENEFYQSKDHHSCCRVRSR
jgi:hypothetical protein